ncbi:MAG TPA: GntR family transcriptional regulator [Trebonia sp.]
MEEIRPSASVREQAASSIRAAIMSGELAPGQRLVEREVCASLNISRNTLRESYRQLEAEGFLEIRPNKGPVVASMTDDQARQIYEAREAIECFAIRLFTERASDSAVDALQETAAGLVEAVENGDVEAVDTWKTRFYEEIFAGAENEYLLEQVRVLYSRLARLRVQSLSYRGRVEQSAAEIREVTVAITDRRGEDAATMWRDHIRHAAYAALHTAAAHPDISREAPAPVP